MITKNPLNKCNCINNRLFFNRARDGFEYLLERLFFENDSAILLPSYIGENDKEGSGVFDPIRNLNLNYFFYEVNHDLSVNLADLRKGLEQRKIKVVLVIHYFGFPQKEIQEIKIICNEFNSFLIEDCAHTLSSCYNGIELGSFGDFSFYSIHKIIAVNDGGILQINNPRFKHLLSSDCNISSDTLLQLLRTDLKKISRIRRENYKLYLTELNRKSDFFDIYYAILEEEVVPLNFPLLIKNYSREKLYYELIKRGIVTVSLYYRLITEIPKNEFPISFIISEKVLNLPVHQDVNQDEIRFICRTLKEFPF